MACKDKYGNNIRRGSRVADLRPDSSREGTVTATYSPFALVMWDGVIDVTDEERVHGDFLVVKDRRL